MKKYSRKTEPRTRPESTESRLSTEKRTYLRISDLPQMQTPEMLSKLAYSDAFLQQQIRLIGTYLLETRTEKIKLSMAHLSTDLRNARNCLNKMPSYSVQEYLAGRTQEVLINDINDTLTATNLIFKKRLFDIVNLITSEDVNEKLYAKFEKNKVKRAEHLQLIYNEINKLPNPYKPYFSQIKASNKFKESTSMGTASDYIIGKSIEEVGNNIKEDPSLSEVIQVGVFRYDGKWVSENNRGLAAASISGIPPVRLSIIFTEQANLNYYRNKLADAAEKHPNARDQDLFLSTLQIENTQNNQDITRLSPLKKSNKCLPDQVTVPNSWYTISPVSVIEEHDFSSLDFAGSTDSYDTSAPSEISGRSSSVFTDSTNTYRKDTPVKISDCGFFSSIEPNDKRDHIKPDDHKKLGRK